MPHISRNTIIRRLEHDIRLLSSPRGYLFAGYPHFKTLFGRDSLISALQLLSYKPAVAKHTLRILADYQGRHRNRKREEEPGKVLHEYRTSQDTQRWGKSFEHLRKWGFPYYGSADSTLWFLILASQYLRSTNDISFIRILWPHIEYALRWIGTYGDKDHDCFIEYERKNPYGLVHQGWRDSTQNHFQIEPPVALVEVQGYAYGAMRGGAYLARALGKEEFSRRLDLSAEKLKEKFNTIFWNKGEYIFAFSKHKSPHRSSTSNQGHLFFTGIISSKKQEQMLATRLFEKDLWTPYGIRTLSEKDKHFNPFSYHFGSVWPHDNWIIYYGLKHKGYATQAKKIKYALLRAYRSLGFLPEYYIMWRGKIMLPELRAACHPQAWTSAALLNMLGDETKI